MLIKTNLDKIPGGQKISHQVQINLKIEYIKVKTQQTQMKF